MKFLTLILTLFMTVTGLAQNGDIRLDSTKNHEIKLNGLFLILGAAEVDYQYLLNDESALGLDLMIGFDDYDLDINYHITPYYRQYFGKKYASGFFVEGFAMLNSTNDYVDSQTNGQDGSIYYDYIYEENIVDLAVGIGTGIKILTKRGFIAELDLGIGRNLFKKDRDFTIIGKGGLQLGYRF
ncbi:hypothetical protein [Croceivirga radicis]|uniref:hypothetical protein n=1 Tax=Croceivirga radicis TaxID=1929488 RepID=UPI00049696C0|nr:hypothetical protein [Croceivirga radicis]